jgi:hypothetical protein
VRARVGGDGGKWWGKRVGDRESGEERQKISRSRFSPGWEKMRSKTSCGGAYCFVVAGLRTRLPADLPPDAPSAAEHRALWAQRAAAAAERRRASRGRGAELPRGRAVLLLLLLLGRAERRGARLRAERRGRGCGRAEGRRRRRRAEGTAARGLLAERAAAAAETAAEHGARLIECEGFFFHGGIDV